jgi:hypothetical protein
MNELQKLIRENAKSVPVRTLLQQVDSLNAVLASREYRGSDAATRLRLKQDALNAIKLDLKINLQEERERIGKQLEKESERYEAEYLREYSLHDFNIRNAERRFRSMSNAELENLVTAYVAEPFSALPDDPHVVDALGLALAERGLPELQVLRETAKKAQYDMPHLRTPIGSELMKQYQLHMQPSDGDFLIEVEGKPVAVSLSDLIEEA